MSAIFYKDFKILFNFQHPLPQQHLFHLPVCLEATLDVVYEARITHAQSLMLVRHVTVIKDAMNVVNAVLT